MLSKLCLLDGIETANSVTERIQPTKSLSDFALNDTGFNIYNIVHLLCVCAFYYYEC